MVDGARTTDGRGRAADSGCSISSAFFDPNETWASGGSIDPVGGHMVRLEALGSGVVANASDGMGRQFDVVQGGGRERPRMGKVVGIELGTAKQIGEVRQVVPWLTDIGYSAKVGATVVFGRSRPEGFAGLSSSDSVKAIVVAAIANQGRGLPLELGCCNLANDDIPAAVARTGHFPYVVSYRTMVRPAYGALWGLKVFAPWGKSNLASMEGDLRISVGLVPRRVVKQVTLPVMEPGFVGFRPDGSKQIASVALADGLPMPGTYASRPPLNVDQSPEMMLDPKDAMALVRSGRWR